MDSQPIIIPNKASEMETVMTEENVKLLLTELVNVTKNMEETIVADEDFRNIPISNGIRLKPAAAKAMKKLFHTLLMSSCILISPGKISKVTSII